MKMKLAFLGMATVFVLVAAGHGTRGYAAAQEQTWTGDISDITCGRSHLKMSQGLFTAPECVIACTEKGKFVFVTTDKIFDIANQDFAGLKEHAGEPVKLTGELKQGEIVVSKIDSSK
ncbi:MAG: hypothetical protein WBD07_10155 [Vicinamibacterales bacterium]